MLNHHTAASGAPPTGSEALGCTGTWTALMLGKEYALSLRDLNSTTVDSAIYTFYGFRGVRYSLLFFLMKASTL